MALPIYQSDSPQMSLMQTAWAQQLNPLIGNPLNNGVLLKSVSLINGTTQVNHKLGRKLVGYIVTRQRAAASIHDSQDTNSMPALTLSLVSNADVTVDLWVF
jgi:hypothetical protein